MDGQPVIADQPRPPGRETLEIAVTQSEDHLAAQLARGRKSLIPAPRRRFHEASPAQPAAEHQHLPSPVETYSIPGLHASPGPPNPGSPGADSRHSTVCHGTCHGMIVGTVVMLSIYDK